MISTAVFISVVTAIGIIIILHKIGIRKFTGYSVSADILLAGLLSVLFYGTFVGMALAAIVGVIISLYLGFAKWFWGAERYVIGKGWVNTEKLKVEE